MLFKGTLSEIKSLITEFFADQSDFSLKNMLENPKSLETLSSILENVADKFDRILFKSHRMLLEMVGN